MGCLNDDVKRHSVHDAEVTLESGRHDPCARGRHEVGDLGFQVLDIGVGQTLPAADDERLNDM